MLQEHRERKVGELAVSFMGKVSLRWVLMREYNFDMEIGVQGIPGKEWHEHSCGGRKAAMFGLVTWFPWCMPGVSIFRSFPWSWSDFPVQGVGSTQLLPRGESCVLRAGEKRLGFSAYGRPVFPLVFSSFTTVLHLNCSCSAFSREIAKPLLMW